MVFATGVGQPMMMPPSQTTNRVKKGGYQRQNTASRATDITTNASQSDVTQENTSMATDTATDSDTQVTGNHEGG